jgi:uncharacterized protein with ParB-like and HNH nuclease domain
MMQLDKEQKIYDVVNAISKDFLRLPSIQRSFVWGEEKIYKLMDSLMNGYRIGSFLVWKPKLDFKIRTKKFVQDYKSGEKTISEDEMLEYPPYLVLDGQQRLQSLFLSFLGKYDGKRLYFKIDSNPDDEESDLRYLFRFMTQENADNEIHWKPVGQIIKLKLKEIPFFVNDEFSDDIKDIKMRIIDNISNFIQIFDRDKLINFLFLKEDMPYNDVLEVFVRVNSGGIVLTKSDLLFATVVLYAPEMERNFIELVDALNSQGAYNFNTDFLIKCSLVLLDWKAQYDVKKLSDGTFIHILGKEFNNIKRALISTIEFIRTDAKILSNRFLKSYLALIPIIDYIYNQPHQQLPEGQGKLMSQYLYMSFFMRFYSYGPDGKLDILHNFIKERKHERGFPIDKIGKYMEERTGVSYTFSENMLYDTDLILNIIKAGVYEIQWMRGWSIERDHIFPNSILEHQKISDNLINDIGNLRLINKTRNILKSCDMPDETTEYYGESDPDLRNLFQNAIENLSEQNFGSFVFKRKELIQQKIKEFLLL